MALVNWRSTLHSAPLSLLQVLPPRPLRQCGRLETPATATLPPPLRQCGRRKTPRRRDPASPRPSQCFNPGDLVEVLPDEAGLVGAHFAAVVVQSKPKARIYTVEYESLVESEGSDRPLRETVPARNVRPRPPRRWASTEHAAVDAFFDGAWWLGVALGRGGGDRAYGARKMAVCFPELREVRKFDAADVRPHLEWSAGKWRSPDSMVSKTMPYTKGSEIEVAKLEGNSIVAWLPAVVAKTIWKNNLLVEYTVSKSDGTSLSEEIVNVVDVRPCPPYASAINISINDEVEALQGDGWWRGVITDVHPELGYTFKSAHFGNEVQLDQKLLRLRYDWVDGQWKRESQEPDFGNKGGPIEGAISLDEDIQEEDQAPNVADAAVNAVAAAPIDAVVVEEAPTNEGGNKRSTSSALPVTKRARTLSSAQDEQESDVPQQTPAQEVPSSTKAQMLTLEPSAPASQRDSSAPAAATGKTKTYSRKVKKGVVKVMMSVKKTTDLAEKAKDTKVLVASSSAAHPSSGAAVPLHPTVTKKAPAGSASTSSWTLIKNQIKDLARQADKYSAEADTWSDRVAQAETRYHEAEKQRKWALEVGEKIAQMKGEEVKNLKMELAKVTAERDLAEAIRRKAEAENMSTSHAFDSLKEETLSRMTQSANLSASYLLGILKSHYPSLDCSVIEQGFGGSSDADSLVESFKPLASSFVENLKLSVVEGDNSPSV